MIAIAKGMPNDNGTRVGGMGAKERAYTFRLRLMTACQMYKGTREGSRMVDIQLANYQTGVGRDAVRYSFWLVRTSSALAARPVVHVSGSSPLEHS
jgi:hypothetical protein